MSGEVIGGLIGLAVGLVATVVLTYMERWRQERWKRIVREREGGDES